MIQRQIGFVIAELYASWDVEDRHVVADLLEVVVIVFSSWGTSVVGHFVNILTVPSEVSALVDGLFKSWVVVVLLVVVMSLLGGLSISTFLPFRIVFSKFDFFFSSSSISFADCSLNKKIDKAKLSLMKNKSFMGVPFYKLKIKIILSKKILIFFIYKCPSWLFYIFNITFLLDRLKLYQF